MVDIRSSSQSFSSFDTSVTVDRPPGAEPRDVLFAFHSTRAPYDGQPDPPGWAYTAEIDDTSGSTFRIFTRVWRRSVTASEPDDYTFPQAVGTGEVTIACVEGANLTTPARIALAHTIFVSGVVTPGVSPAAGETVEIRYAATADNVALQAPSGYTPHEALALTANLSTALASKQLSSSAPSGEKIFAGGSSTTNGVTISIAAGVIVPDLPVIPADAPGQGDALYSFRFSRLFGGHLGILDLAGVSFEKRINRRGQINVGNFSATYTLSNEDEGDLVANIVPRYPSDLMRGPGVTVVDIYRATVHWGRYWIVGAKINKQRRSRPALTLSGVTMDAYLQYVALEEQLGPFAAEDRVEIARQVIAHMQTQEHADIGLILADGSSGSTLTRTYEAHAGMYGQHLADTTAGVDGYDWMINTALGAGGVELHWKWGKPLGDEHGPAQHTFTDSPGGGEILDYGIDMTPLTHGTRFRARGDTIDTDASEPSKPLLSDPFESPHLATGVWPRVDRTVDRPGVTDLAALNAVAEELAGTSGGAPHVFSITVLLGEEPTIHPNLLGDSARIVISDEWFKRINGGAGLNERRRILGMRVTPTGRENGRDEAQLYIDDLDQAVE